MFGLGHETGMREYVHRFYRTADMYMESETAFNVVSAEISSNMLCKTSKKRRDTALCFRCSSGSLSFSFDT